MFQKAADRPKWYERPLPKPHTEIAGASPINVVREQTREEILLHRLFFDFSNIQPSEVDEMIAVVGKLVPLVDKDRIINARSCLNGMRQESLNGNSNNEFDAVLLKIIDKSNQEIGEGVYAWMGNISTIKEKYDHKNKKNFIADASSAFSTVRVFDRDALNSFAHLEGVLDKDLIGAAVMLHEYTHLLQTGYIKSIFQFLGATLGIIGLSVLIGIQSGLLYGIVTDVIGTRFIGKDLGSIGMPEREILSEGHAYFNGTLFQDETHYDSLKKKLEKYKVIKNPEQEKMYQVLYSYLLGLYALGATDKEVGMLVHFAFWDKKTETFPNMKKALQKLQQSRGFSDEQLKNLITLYYAKHSFYRARLQEIAVEEIEKIKMEQV